MRQVHHAFRSVRCAHGHTGMSAMSPNKNVLNDAPAQNARINGGTKDQY